MWIGRLVVLVFLMLLAPDAHAQTLTRGPLIQNPDALTTTMTIEWWTDVAGNSTVEYGLTPALGSSVTVGQAGSCEIGSAGTCHTVPLTGLLPGTRYYYRLLTNGLQVLATTYFQTMQVSGDPNDLYFAVLGDFGDSTTGQANVANNLNTGDAPLLLTVGDNAYTNGTQSDWDNNVFISQFRNGILRRSLFMTTLGNHDLNNVGASNWFNSVEIKLMLNPRNAPSGQEERYYSFDYGDAHFIVLDANPPAIGSTQNNWLAADLAATTRKWKFVFLHQTPYSCANGIASIGSDLTVRNNWGPLFEQYKVDVVFTGHDHSYERSKVVDDYLVGGGSGSDGLGTIYVMTGGGGATLDGAANADGGGPYRQPLFGSKTYCPWLANNCANGVAGQYCSFSTFQHTDVRIVNNNTMTLRGINSSNAVFDTLVITKNAVCGNGTVEVGELCDQGAANGSSTSCCTAACLFVVVGTQCRASGGVCDVAETCSGLAGACPANGFAASSTVCRGAAGVCDVAENCTGSSAACPANGFAPSSTVCRGAAGVCDAAESCTGSSAACPSDQKSSAVCRPSAGVCDLTESCDGVSNNCPGDMKDTTVCRAAAGVCDLAEFCDGIGNACPADQKSTTLCRGSAGVCDVPDFCDGLGNDCPVDAKSTAVCRGSAGVCDVAESCDGVGNSCPANGFVPSTTTCRPSAGDCDPAETCTGVSAACPTDAKSTAECRGATDLCDAAESCDGVGNDCPTDGFSTSGTPCRTAAGSCDTAEECTGTSAACPADALVPSGTVCRASTGTCDVAEECTGSNPACPADGFVASGTSCRASAGSCDPAEVCTGTSGSCPADALEPSGTVCRASAGACDLAETCSGSSAACPADAKSSGVCRPSAGACDPAESCDGVSDACPADGLAASGTVCRAAAGPCDVPEACTGTGAGCPANGFASSSTVCRPASGDCDVAEACGGSSASCPANGFASSGTVCGASTGPCDPAEVCSGATAACGANMLAPSGTICRPSAGACDAAETCSGASAACPADTLASSGTVCRGAAGVCDLAEACNGVSSTCPADTKSTAVCRPAAGLCDVAESCDGAANGCPADALASSGVECRASTSACDVAEVCSGTDASCPADVGEPDGDGDGVCDAQDDCPGDYDPDQDDGDNDGPGDACDPCTNGVTVALPKLTVTKLLTGPFDDKITFKGEMAFPYPFDPNFYPPGVGARVLVKDVNGALLIDAPIPTGFYNTGTLTGWKLGGSSTWTFKHPTGIQGVTKVVLKHVVNRPGVIKFTVLAKFGSWAVNPGNIPLSGTVVVDAPTADSGQCGEASFPGPAGVAPACAFNASGSTLRCK